VAGASGFGNPTAQPGSGDGDTGTGTTSPGTGMSGTQCASVEVRKQQPVIEFVVDGSGSMCADFNGATRWQALRGALLEPDMGVIQRFDAQAEFGMTLYDGGIDIFLAAASAGGGGGGGGGQDCAPIDAAPMECPRLIEVPPALGNAAAIDAMFPNAQLGGSTPTDRALSGVVDRLVTLGQVAVDQERPVRYVILATDGQPNDICVGGMGGDGSVQRQAVLDHVQRAADDGIRTFVISLAGNDQALQAHLDEVAAVGDPGNPDAATFTPASPEDLAMVMNDLVGGAIGCEVTLNGSVMPAFACDGSVVLQDEEIPCCRGDDCAEGWKLSEPNRIELLGDACDTLRLTPGAVLSADFPCGVFAPD
jgi:hypothetical protein